MHPQAHTLDLFDQPQVTRRKSQITGRFIAVDTDGKAVRRVDVAGEQGAEAHVEVDVAVAVDVLEPRALGSRRHSQTASKTVSRPTVAAASLCPCS